MSLLTCLLAALAWAAPADQEKGRFEYDPADEMVRATTISDANGYDPHIVSRDGRLWIAWLEFEPGQGDRIWLGGRDEQSRDWAVRRSITSEPGIYKNPTLTPQPSGGFWLTVERQQGEAWSIVALRLDRDLQPATSGGSTPAAPSLAGAIEVGPGINHRTAAAPDGAPWIVWQANRQGRFRIEACRLTETGPADHQMLSDPSSGNAWQPDVAVLADGDVAVVWDGVQVASDGFDTYLARRQEGRWSATVLLGATEAFEARASIVADSVGRVWTTWEEGNCNWGKTYRYRMNRLSPGYQEMTDEHGPLHAFRWLHVESIAGAGSHVPVDPPLAMVAFDQLSHRPNPKKGVEHLGGFYEGAEPVIDGLDRLWVIYRHYYMPWMGLDRITHKQEDWGVYARCFDGQAWSKLFRMDLGQGDGMQRLCASGLPDGIALVYTTGRTDRRPESPVRGMALATIHLPGARVETQITGTPAPPATRKAAPTPAAPANAAAEQVFFGDLHRHTDLSLCNVPTDGTMDDAYRYAIDVARLDFLGITDHARDIADGDAKSLLYWRCRKEVSRHDLSAQFIPMYAYEHSRAGEDHNVVSLHPVLWPDRIPFPELWPQMDGDTFSIPHQTICGPIPPSGEMPAGLDAKTWNYGDQAHRRLMEIYQGCRDRSIERDAHVALGKGHIMGFIASSDHLSTSGSYAGVWAKDRTRASVFRAMQARRTFGATARISLKVTMGGHWMGEQVPSGEVAPLHVEVEGTAPISTLDLIVDGCVQQTLPQSAQRLDLNLSLPPLTGDVHYSYVRVQQADGNRAWSSPIWLTKTK